MNRLDLCPPGLLCIVYRLVTSLPHHQPQLTVSFFKLDAGILDSTIWSMRTARSVFITAGLMAVPHEVTEPLPQLKVRSLEPTGWTVPPGWYGLIPASADGIARRDGCTLTEALDALEELGSPDVLSRSSEYEGRRLVRVSGGYLMLNYARYRDRDLTNAERQRRYRQRQKLRPTADDVTLSGNGNVTQRPTVTEEEEEEEGDKLPTTELLLGDRQKRNGVTSTDDDPIFEAAWKAYPKRDGGNSKADALKAWRARVRAGASPDAMYQGVHRYAAHIRAKGKEGTEFVKRAATFFGPGEHWKEAYTVSSNGRSAVGREQVDQAAAEAFDANPNLGTLRGVPGDSEDLSDL